MRLPHQRPGAARSGQPQSPTHAGVAPRNVYYSEDDLALDELDADEFDAPFGDEFYDAFAIDDLDA